MKNKTCKKCKESKSLKDFYKTTIYKWEIDGHDYYCKNCRLGTVLKSHRVGVRKKKCSIENCELNHYAKSYCRNHYTRMHRNGTTDLINTGKKKYKNNDALTLRRNRLKSIYKITLQQYDEMAKDGCEICGKQALPHKYLHIDHDHKCCPVSYDKNNRSAKYKTCGLCLRGILCDACNTAVGKYENDKMRDDYPLKNEVIAYVAKYDWVISDRIDTNDKKQRNRKR